MNSVIDLDSEDSEFVEVDPTGRYGRYNEILGKGASKTVYRAFDEYEGIEVAWNQVKLYDFLQSPEDLERLYCEIHLLKTLKHRNIMKFYTSWVDTANRNINFVTEMFTSGTLRQYRMKHKRTNIRAIKHWCRQILQGLVYIHSHDPPVIHRDLKCDNIFINGNQGEVKIGDLGLAAILRKSQASRCVGTPEFMAPEVYEEEYNELVDIYSFGMCILEMVTFEYPYSECTHPAQIYKKVISGKKPDALYKVKDPEVRRFVEKCLATVSDRLSAWELLNDPFLQIDDYGYDLRSLSYLRDYDDIRLVLRQPHLSAHHSTTNSMVNGFSNYICYDNEHDFDSHSVGYEAAEIDLFMSQGEEHLEDVDVSIRGRRSEDDNIFLRLRITDKEGKFHQFDASKPSEFCLISVELDFCSGRVRNIYFPFDIETDTALSVATEMVAELDIMDQDVTKIAEMIDNEIASLVPEWRKSDVLNECQDYQSNSCCQNCDARDPTTGYSSSHRRSKSVQVGCGSVHGRFEEITYQSEGSDHQHVDHDPNPLLDELRPSDGGDAWAQHEDHHDAFSQAPGDHHLSFENDHCSVEEHAQPSDDLLSQATCLDEDNRNTIKQQPEPSSVWNNLQFTSGVDEIKERQRGKHFTTFPPLNLNKNSTNPTYNSCNPARLVATGDGFCSGTLLPHPIHHATSLPVNAAEF